MLKERVERKLERSGRITPREVLEAYEKTGERVVFGKYLWWMSACAMGAVALANGCSRGEGEAGVIRFHLARLLQTRFNPNSYMFGFELGFDGCEPTAVKPGLVDGIGYRDGLRARRFVFARLPDRLEQPSE